jgi:hypothetical protein
MWRKMYVENNGWVSVWRIAFRKNWKACLKFWAETMVGVLFWRITFRQNQKACLTCWAKQFCMLQLLTAWKAVNSVTKKSTPNSYRPECGLMNIQTQRTKHYKVQQLNVCVCGQNLFVFNNCIFNTVSIKKQKRHRKQYIRRFNKTKKNNKNNAHPCTKIKHLLIIYAVCFLFDKVMYDLTCTL